MCSAVQAQKTFVQLHCFEFPLQAYSINMADKPEFLNEVPGEHHLRHVDSNDKSKPVIDPGGHLA